MVGCLAREGPGLHAADSAHQAAVDSQRYHLARSVGMLARANIAEPGQKCRSNQVAIAEHCGAVRKHFCDVPELAAVQHLAMRQMHVGNRNIAKVQNLAGVVEHRARRQRQHHRRGSKCHCAPDCEPVDAAGQRTAHVVTPPPWRQVCPFRASSPASAEVPGAPAAPAGRRRRARHRASGADSSL